MKKGNYSRIFGCSKSGYEKGVKDTLKFVGVAILSIATAVFAVINSKKK